MNKLLQYGLMLAFYFATLSITYSQDDRQIVQLTGVVVAEDGRTQMPGVHVYVPESGRGTSSNIYGYFSMPALVGEEIVLSSVGYLKQTFVIPSSENDRVNVVFRMELDTTYLENVDITPYLSEKMFKEAILAMDLPDPTATIGDRLDGAALSRMFGSVPYDASLNARYYFDQQYRYQQDNYGPRSNPFLNPFNWANFIKSLKK